MVQDTVQVRVFPKLKNRVYFSVYVVAAAVELIFSGLQSCKQATDIAYHGLISTTRHCIDTGLSLAFVSASKYEETV